MDILSEIRETKQQIAKVASKIEELECSLKTATSAEQTNRIDVKLDKLQDEKIILQGQLEELYKRLPLNSSISGVAPVTATDCSSTQASASSSNAASRSQVPERLFRLEMMLCEVDGSLATLSEYRGFRRFIQAKATDLGLGGTIQRYDKSDVKVVLEGTKEQVANFVAFLDYCIKTYRMMEKRRFINPMQEVMLAEYNDFAVVKDHRKQQGRGGTIVKGQFSDGNDYDCVTTSSANSPVLQGSQPSRPASRARNRSGSSSSVGGSPAGAGAKKH